MTQTSICTEVPTIYIESGPPASPLESLTVSEVFDAGVWTMRQRLMVLLASMASIMDGFDGQLIGYAAPAILKAWGLERGAFAFVIAIGLIGMALGSALAGAIGDHRGRKIAIVGSVMTFGLATVASGFADSPTQLAICRFITGLGVGGALPSATTYAAEFSPPRFRTLAITAAIICVPVGGMLAGLFASLILPAFDWRALFMTGGLFPVALAGLFGLYLVESPRWLAEQDGSDDRLRTILIGLGKAVPACVHVVADSKVQPAKPSTSFRAIFQEGRLLSTLCLWSACFMVLLAVYASFSWLPAMLVADGRTASQAGQGLTAFNLGGVMGGMICAMIVTRFGSRWPMAFFAVAAAISAFVLANMTASAKISLLMTMITLLGLFVNSIQCLLYSLAAHVYPTAIRTRGTAWTLIIGRLGAITSAFLGAMAISRGGGSAYFYTLAVAMTLAMVALVILPRHILGSRHLR